MTIDEEVLEAVAEELAQCLHEDFMGRLPIYPPSIRRMAENCIIAYEHAKKPDALVQAASECAHQLREAICHLKHSWGKEGFEGGVIFDEMEFAIEQVQKAIEQAKKPVGDNLSPTEQETASPANTALVSLEKCASAVAVELGEPHDDDIRIVKAVLDAAGVAYVE